MSDSEIIALYTERSESAIEETAKQYAAYCTTIAMNILHSCEDAEECVNDAYLAVWNAIPPECPQKFSAYIGRIVRNLSLDRYEKRNAQKRGGSGADLLLSELGDCIPTVLTVERQADSNELSRVIDDFLANLAKEKAAYFLCRY